MTSSTDTIRSDDTLGDLASSYAGASRVFHRHGLDFCCGGAVSLQEACAERTLDVDALIAEIQAETAGADFERWDERGTSELIEHILTRFHEPHRAELPRLIEMAHKVERVHADKPTCPSGLAQHLEALRDELELHMQKEEQILFPMLRSGRAAIAAGPISVMEEEHRAVGAELARTRELTNDFNPPEEACGTWTALYLGVAELERELMQHVHLENNVLFRRVD